MEKELPQAAKPLIRREFLISTGAAAALTVLSGSAFAKAKPRRPPDGLPLPTPKRVLDTVFGLKKPPAPFTLVDFERNPFQRPMGLAYDLPDLPDPGRSPKHGRGIADSGDDLEKESDGVGSDGNRLGDERRQEED